MPSPRVCRRPGWLVPNEGGGWRGVTEAVPGPTWLSPELMRGGLAASVASSRGGELCGVNPRCALWTRSARGGAALHASQAGVVLWGGCGHSPAACGRLGRTRSEQLFARWPAAPGGCCCSGSACCGGCEGGVPGRHGQRLLADGPYSRAGAHVCLQCFGCGRVSPRWATTQKASAALEGPVMGA